MTIKEFIFIRLRKETIPIEGVSKYLDLVSKTRSVVVTGVVFVFRVIVPSMRPDAEPFSEYFMGTKEREEEKREGEERGD